MFIIQTVHLNHSIPLPDKCFLFLCGSCIILWILHCKHLQGKIQVLCMQPKVGTVSTGVRLTSFSLIQGVPKMQCCCSIHVGLCTDGALRTSPRGHVVGIYFRRRTIFIFNFFSAYWLSFRFILYHAWCILQRV